MADAPKKANKIPVHVPEGSTTYGMVLPGGRRVEVRATTSLDEITGLSIRYPNGSSVTVGQRQNGEGKFEDGKNTLRIAGMGVTPNLAASDIKTVLTGTDLVQTMIDRGRIDNSGAAKPVDHAHVAAEAFAARITPADAVRVQTAPELTGPR